MSVTFEYEPESERVTLEPRWVRVFFDGIPVARITRTENGVVATTETMSAPDPLPNETLRRANQEALERLSRVIDRRLEYP